MQRAPQTKGLFTIEFIIDTIAFGFIMGAISLLAFVFSLFVFKGGDIGTNCNTVGEDAVGCSSVYESRSVIFILMSMLLLIHAFNCKDLREPIWRINLLNNKVIQNKDFGQTSCIVLCL
jgi:magnesium-transporting ATPase (P-type)